MDGEDLDVNEDIQVSVEFLKYKSTEVLSELSHVIDCGLVDNDGRSLLHWAAVKGQLEKARFLLSNQKVDKDAKDRLGYNALELACKKGHKKLMEYLQSQGLTCNLPENKALNREVDLNIEGRLTACMYADNSAELQEILWYVKNKKGFFSIPEFYEWTLIGLCCYFLAPKCLKLLLIFGCDIDQPDGDNMCPIENVLNSVISVLPPENEEEYVEFNSGMDCLVILVPHVKNINEHSIRLNTVLKRSALVGKGSSTAHSEYEHSVSKKAIGLRLMLSTIPFY